MDIVQYKDKIAELQNAGLWNESIDVLRNGPIMCGNFEFDLLVISELYWYIEEQSFYMHNPHQMAKGYDSIVFDFDELFGDVVEYAMSHYNDNYIVIWIIALWIAIDFVPFLQFYDFLYIERKGKEMFNMAEQLAKGKPYENLIKKTNGTISIKTEGVKEIIHQEMLSMNLRKNNSDIILEGFLEY